MSISTIQNNFASGELSPSLYARSDRPFYKTAAEIMVNFIPELTGNLRFLRGTQYSVHSRQNKDVWGLPFRFNLEQAYTLEFTDYKMRVHKNGGVVLEDAKTITGISQANPGVITITSHGYATGDEIYLSGVIGPDELNGQFYQVVYINANTFSLTDVHGTTIDTTDLDAYVSGGSAYRVYEIDSPYTAEEAKTLKYSGTADLMYLMTTTREPRVLIRQGNTDWSINTYSRYSATKDISAITQASPGVVTSNGHGLATNDRIYIDHVKGMTQINAQEYYVVYIDANTFSLKTLAGTAVNTSGYSAYVEGGDIAIVSDAPLTITGITKANPGVITITGHGLSDKDKIFVSGISGMTELNDLNFWVRYINADTFSLTDELGNDIDTTAYTTYTSGGQVEKWRGIFTKIDDFPGACGFFGGRFYAGGTENDPATFWGSMAPDPDTGAAQYDIFTIGTEDVDGFVYTLSPQNDIVQQIYWFSGTKDFMVIGTSGGVQKANGGQDGTSITPTAVLVVPVSSIAVANIPQLYANDQTYYVEDGHDRVRGFGYNFLTDSYKAYDKNALADEIAELGIIQLAFADGVIYAVRTDGVLLACRLLESEDTAGWARVKIGGEGKVLSIVVEPRAVGDEQIGVYVERTIDSNTVRYLEYFSQDPAIPDFSEYFTGEDNYDADRSRYEKIVFELQKQINRFHSALFFDGTQDSLSLTLAALTGDEIVVTASGSLFSSDDIGRAIFAKFITGEETGIGEIVEYVSATQVKINIREDFSALAFSAGGWYFGVNKIYGLNHLEGETVGVLTDGAVHSDVEIVDGKATLDYSCRYCIVGEKYTGFFRSLDLVFSTAEGGSQARLRDIGHLFLWLRNSLGGKVGTTTYGPYKLSQLDYRKASQSYYDRPPVLFSGLKKAPVKGDWANEKKITIVQDQPFPFDLLAIVSDQDVGGVE